MCIRDRSTTVRNPRFVTETVTVTDKTQVGHLRRTGKQTFPSVFLYL